MSEQPSAFNNEPLPNAWAAGRAEGGGAKGHGYRDGKGNKGWKGPGKGPGKGAKRGKGKQHELTLERRAELAAEVRAFAAGLPSPSCKPALGDKVVVLRVLGADRQRVQGRQGEVLGCVAEGAVWSCALCTVRLEMHRGDPDSTPPVTTFPADQLRVVGGRPPLHQMVLPFELTGLERKFVHSMAESLGVQSQSFGQAADRRLVLIRALAAASEGAASAQIPGSTTGQTSLQQTGGSANSRRVRSGIELFEDSRVALLRAVGHLAPDDWVPVDHCQLVVCHGPLSNPCATHDRRDVVKDLRSEVQGLVLGREVQLRVASVGITGDCLAVGVVGAPALAKNPHIILALAPGASERAGACIRTWDLWEGEPLVLEGAVREWSAATEATQDPDSVAALASLASAGDAAAAVAPSEDTALRVRVTTVRGEELKICTTMSARALDLKAAITAEMPDFGDAVGLRLVFAGRVLDDAVELVTAGVREGSTLVAVPAKPAPAAAAAQVKE